MPDSAAPTGPASVGRDDYSLGRVPGEARYSWRIMVVQRFAQLSTPTQFLIGATLGIRMSFGRAFLAITLGSVILEAVHHRHRGDRSTPKASQRRCWPAGPGSAAAAPALVGLVIAVTSAGSVRRPELLLRAEPGEHRRRPAAVGMVPGRRRPGHRHRPARLCPDEPSRCRHRPRVPPSARVHGVPGTARAPDQPPDRLGVPLVPAQPWRWCHRRRRRLRRRRDPRAGHDPVQPQRQGTSSSRPRSA